MSTNTETRTTPHARTMTGTDEDRAAPESGELLHVGDTENAGAIVWWELHGDVDLGELAELHTSTGGNADDLPAPPTSAAALRAALKAVVVARGLLCRADPRGDGWVLQTETAAPGVESAPAARQPRGRRKARNASQAPVEGASGGDAATDGASPSTPPSNRPAPPVVVLEAPEERLQHRTVAEVCLVSAGAGFSDTLQVRTLDEALAAEIQSQYDYFCGALTPRDLAYWLPETVARLDGVGLRQKGGVYFLPRAGLAKWSHLVRTLRAVSSHRVFQVPVMPADDAAEAFLDAMDREARAFVDAAIVDLPGLKANGRKTRLRDTQALMAKVGRYEALFGAGRLEGIRKLLADMEVACSIADVMGTSETSEAA